MNFEDMKVARVETLEARYVNALASKDQATMDRTIGDLMAIRGIEPEDKRVADLKKRKVPNFNRDYRSDINYVSKWVMGESPYVEHIEATAEEHEGIRIEGNYSGTITIPKRVLKLDIREIKSANSLNNIQGAIKVLDKKCERKGIKIPDTFKDSACMGKYAVYKVELNFSQNFPVKEFGYVIVSRLKNENIRATVILDTAAMRDNHISAVKVEDDVAHKMFEALKHLNPNDTIETKVVGRDAK